MALTNRTDIQIYDRQIGNGVDDMNIEVSYDPEGATGQLRLRFFISDDNTTYYPYTGIFDYATTTNVFATSTTDFIFAPSKIGTSTIQHSFANLNTLWWRTQIERNLVGTGRSVSDGNVMIKLKMEFCFYHLTTIKLY